ncbi:MAG TPA: cell division protein ZapA [Vicinamibacterales bacterium]|nr:cell division protein ZapA [Vicinamibacterales bacterium]
MAGQRYPIRSELEERYVAELAAYVDLKMRAASDAAPASDILGLAVLVALNLADECFRARADRSDANGEMQQRAIQLERIVDQVLAQIAETKAG